MIWDAFIELKRIVVLILEPGYPSLNRGIELPEVGLNPGEPLPGLAVNCALDARYVFGRVSCIH